MLSRLPTSWKVVHPARLSHHQQLSLVTLLVRQALRLELLDPRLVLQRGYALLTDTAGQAVTSVRQAQPGDALRATLADGAVDVTVVQPRLL